MTFIFLTLLFLSICSFASMSHTAFFSIRSSQLHFFSTSKDVRERCVFHLLENPQDLLITILFCDITANVLTHNATAHLLPSQSNWFFHIALPFVLTLFLGDLIPKNFGYSYNIKIAKTFSPFLLTLRTLLWPARKVIKAITSLFERAFRLKPETGDPPTKEEYHYLLETANKLDLLSSDETALITGYVDLREIKVKQKMIPRGEMHYFDLKDGIYNLKNAFSTNTASELLLCSDSLQNPKGILHVSNVNAILSGKTPIENALTPPLFIPQTMDLHTLYQKMQKQKKALAIVLNEYGTIVGSINLTKIISIWLNPQSVTLSYFKTPEGSLITSGKLELKTFESLYKTSLPKRSEIVTLGGWLSGQMGEIPKPGATYQWKNFQFKVISALPQKINEIEVNQLND
jgi:putative hemolysin